LSNHYLSAEGSGGEGMAMTPTGQRDSMPVPSQEDLSISAARGERGKSDAQPRIQFKLTGQPARTTTTLGVMTDQRRQFPAA
jgi:hypothetical protein